MVFVVTVSMAQLVHAAESRALISVAVNGQPISRDDIRALVKGAFAARPQQVPKEPAAMPSDAPLVFYAGHGTIWVSKTVDADLGAFAREMPAQQPAEDAFVAAVALAAMDAGTAGKPWQDIYRQVSSDEASRLAFGKSIAEALKTASDQSAAFAADQSAWIQSQIAPGTTRDRAYAMLKSRGLVAYNPAFEQSRAIGDSACLPPLDPNSGNWPYQNEPVPKNTGACALMNGETKPMPNPDAMVKLGGAFGLGCEEATLTTINFGADDRVSKVTIDKLSPSCI
jgi:hypothetical protein